MSESHQLYDKMDDVSPVVMKVGMAVAAHPLEYAKVLVQMGYEPIAPRPSKTFLTRQPALILPSLFQYIGHIRKKDGFFGLYRGLTPRVLETGLAVIVSQKVEEKWEWAIPYADKDDEELDEAQRQEKYLNKAVKEGAQRLACIVVTQPLRVITVRCMAQFIGGENKYSGILDSIKSILEENGIAGYWAGMVPRAAGELSLVGISAVLTYLINNYLIDKKELKSYTALIVNFFASSWCYPFQVVSNCMIVSKSGLIAGYPPHMPLYGSWVDCWQHLSKNRQLKRGASLLIRYYNGPKVIVGDRIMPLNPNMLPK